MAPVIGIDLGTSNTCAAVVLNGDVKIIPDERGRSLVPSVVTQNKYGRFVVGHFAKSQLITNPYETIYSIKRLLGQKYDAEEMESVRRYLSYPIERDERNGGILIPLRDHRYTPTELSAQILMKVKENARRFLGEEVDRAVITVPAHFNDIQRRETKRCGEMAGFDVLRLINEPTAAALAFGFGGNLSTRVAVFDFGGGTFDISVLNIEGNIFEVVSTGGDSYLGGDDFNWRLVEHVAAEFLASENINLKMDKMAMQRLLDACEGAKVALSSRPQFVVDLPRVAPNIDINAHLRVTTTRKQLEQMARDLIERSLKICQATFNVAKLSANDIDEFLMVGGQSKMPLIQAMVKRQFGRPLNTTLDPEEVVGIGAAIQAQTLTQQGDPTLLLDVTPLTLGLASFKDIFVPLIHKNTKIPHSVSKIFTTLRENQDRVRILAYQGEQRRASENQLLGQFVLEGIEQAARMVPRIEVMFRLDANGILHVGARDEATGEEKGISIDNYTEIAANASLEDGVPPPDLEAEDEEEELLPEGLDALPVGFGDDDDEVFELE